MGERVAGNPVSAGSELMMKDIIADYGFYIGWSFGATAFLMAGEWLMADVRRRVAIRRLRRMARLNEPGAISH